MLHLYYHDTTYCLVNTATLTPSLWCGSAEDTIYRFFKDRPVPYPEHTCFTDNADYELIATFPALTSLKDFHDQFPEIFI